MSTEQRSEPRLSREQQFAFDCWTEAGGVLRDRILRASGLPSAYWVELQATIASIIAHRRLAPGGYLQRGMVRASGPDTTAVYGPTRKDDSGGWGAALADATQLVQSLEVQRDEAKGKHESFRERIRYTLELPLSVTDDDLVFAVGSAREAQKEAEDDGGEEDADRTSDTPSPAPAERELGEDELLYEIRQAKFVRAALIGCARDSVTLRLPDGDEFDWKLRTNFRHPDSTARAKAYHFREYKELPHEARSPEGLVIDMTPDQVRDPMTKRALEFLWIAADGEGLIFGVPGNTAGGTYRFTVSDAARMPMPHPDASQAARLREIWDKCTKVEERARVGHARNVDKQRRRLLARECEVKAEASRLFVNRYPFAMTDEGKRALEFHRARAAKYARWAERLRNG